MRTTIRLSDEAADAIDAFVSPYGGSVPAFASKLTEDFARLSKHDRSEMLALLEIKLRRLADRETDEPRTGRDIGEVPAIPNR